jgi:hypothetical protein
MNDTAVGFLIVGVGMLFVLGIVYAISSRPRPAAPPPVPPPGVHLPPPSYLPVVLSLAAALLGAGLAFRSDEQLANPFLAIPGVLVFVAGVVWWVVAANREWHEVEHGTGHGPAHGAGHAGPDTQRAHDDHSGS